MEKIEKIRKKIDLYDDEFINLLEKRMECIKDIIDIKKEKCLPILQSEYENKKEVALINKLKGNKFENEIIDVFRYMVKTSKKIQAKNLFSYNIMLVGFMGVGKSTISSYLGHLLEMERVETDSYIIKQQGMSISEIFEKLGEEYFRNLESQTLIDLQKKKGIVVSCGGGIVLRDKNVEYIKKNGRVVLLTASPETILQRVKHSDERPILNNNMNVEFISDLMKKREGKYLASADIIINTDNKTIKAICEEMIVKLTEFDK
ncbi:AAA family ATPase [Clostridioides difficile]|nr:AAA family ATPase [Clostridioides difficile]